MAGFLASTSAQPGCCMAVFSQACPFTARPCVTQMNLICKHVLE